MTYRNLFFFIFFLPLVLLGQETIFEEKTTIYVDEYSGGLGLHTNGFSLNFRYGKYKGAFEKRVYEIEFSSLKHPKEIKTISQFEDDVKGYVFGKLNSFFTFRPSIGFHKVFMPKQSIKGISMTYQFHLGPSLGLAKPVYLNIREKEENTNVNSYNIVTRRYNPSIHNQGDIYGRASFFKGFEQMKLYPGLFTKFALEFDYSSRRESIRAVEVGLTADIFMKKIPIMAFAENRSFFLNLFLAITFGEKNTR